MKATSYTKSKLRKQIHSANSFTEQSWRIFTPQNNSRLRKEEQDNGKKMRGET